jgi:hypothetical protein
MIASDIVYLEYAVDGWMNNMTIKKEFSFENKLVPISLSGSGTFPQQTPYSQYPVPQPSHTGSNQSRYHQHHPSSGHSNQYAGSSNDGLSAAAVAASSVMTKGYAQLNAADLPGVDDSFLAYGELLGSYPNFASPSSDGWSSLGSNASPEQSISNASTPSSTESFAIHTQGLRSATAERKYVPLKQEAREMQREKYFSATASSNPQTKLRSSASKPDLTGMDKGGGSDADALYELSNHKY